MPALGAWRGFSKPRPRFVGSFYTRRAHEPVEDLRLLPVTQRAFDAQPPQPPLNGSVVGSSIATSPKLRSSALRALRRRAAHNAITVARTLTLPAAFESRGALPM